MSWRDEIDEIARRRSMAAELGGAESVARQHERIRHQRLDFWHQLTRQLAVTYGVIGLEQLALPFMTRLTRADTFL